MQSRTNILKIKTQCCRKIRVVRSTFMFFCLIYKKIKITKYIWYKNTFQIFRWCMLFSHPSDFTPVCTTELGRIAVHQPHFTKRNVKLIAHSVDDLGNHEDWVNVKLNISTI